MEDEGRDDTLGFEALGLRGNCCKTPACQVGGVRGEEGRKGVVDGDGRHAHELANPAVGGSGGGREGRAVTKGGLVDEGSDGADDRSWGFDRERGEAKTTLADREGQEGNCGPQAWTRAGIRSGGGGAKDTELGGDDGRVKLVDDEVGVGQGHDTHVVVKEIVAAGSQKFRGKLGLVVGQGEDVVDPGQGRPETVFQGNTHEVGTPDRAPCDEDPRAHVERHTVGPHGVGRAGGRRGEDKGSLQGVPEETNGVRKAVEVGLEGGNPIVKRLPGVVDVRSGGRPKAVEVVGEGPHEDPMGAIESRERGVHKVVGCEVETEGAERAAHAHTLLPEDNAEKGMTLIGVPGSFHTLMMS